MAVDIIHRIYEGRPYIFYKGIDETGLYGEPGGFIEFIEEGIKYENGLTGRFYPDLHIQQHNTGNCVGNVSWMKTTYLFALFMDNGKMVPNTKPTNYHPVLGQLTVNTNTKDRKSFELQFHVPVGSFRLNGFVRGVFGQNGFPVINTNPERTDVPMWAVIPQTLAEETIVPTHDYRTGPGDITPSIPNPA